VAGEENPRAATDKHLGDDARKELRQSRSRPILDRLRGYLDTMAETAATRATAPSLRDRAPSPSGRPLSIAVPTAARCSPHAYAPLMGYRVADAVQLEVGFPLLPRFSARAAALPPSAAATHSVCRLVVFNQALRIGAQRGEQRP
jgi:hypothetical protein